MNVLLKSHTQYLSQEMYVQIELNVDHLQLPMSNYHSKEHLAMFLKYQIKMLTKKRSFYPTGVYHGFNSK
jgi:hypothetical protein